MGVQGEALMQERSTLVASPWSNTLNESTDALGPQDECQTSYSGCGPTPSCSRVLYAHLSAYAQFSGVLAEPPRRFNG